MGFQTLQTLFKDNGPRSHNLPLGKVQFTEASNSRMTIREELRACATSENVPEIIDRPQDAPLAARVTNLITSVGGRLKSLDEESAGTQMFDALRFGQDEDAGVAGAGDRRVGDLVLLTSPGDRRGTLGIYLGYFSGRHHFYSQDARWLMSSGYPIAFSVANFATEEELRLVLAAIPKGQPIEVYQQLQKQNQGPSRNDGAGLLQRMHDFRLESERIHQNNMVVLDRAREALSDEAESIQNAVKVVREYNLASAKSNDEVSAKSLQGLAIGQFIAEARQVVAQSRAVRSWTPHGILEPSGGFNLRTPSWNKTSIDILNYLEWWASHDLFTASSRYHSYGAIILRAVGLYEDALLDQHTAWTFLQELGHIDSRQIPSRYRIRLPGTTFAKRGLERAPISYEAIQESRRPDVAAASRSEVAGGTVLCIDDPSTVLIDDGVSVERTDNPTEFWVHVHVADPASQIRAGSELAAFMELIPSNIYLPGHFQAMLPSAFHHTSEVSGSKGHLDDMSLRAGSPALTFSSKVNTAGEILDYTIKPTKLTSVAYLDPKDVSEFCGERPPPSAPAARLSVGGPFTAEVYGRSRTMISASDLNKSDQDDLRTLFKLSEALRAKRLAKGAWPYFFPRPSVSVTFPPEQQTDEASSLGANSSNESLWIPADPQIDVAYDKSFGCSVVSNTMVLAGEIAARWCSQRGIPAPYRRDTLSARNYDAALAYVKEYVYPLVEKGIEPAYEHRGNLATLIGGTELSVTPGRNFIMGLDMYTKVTSPLRRFGDLLAHWQIHAALAHEHQIGRKLDPIADKEALREILPFTAEDLERTLVHLQMREKMISAISQCSRDWILIALARAWRADDGTLPSTMRFTVASRGTAGLRGELRYFGLPAVMSATQLDGKALIQNISVGDQLEVEIVDINVYEQLIEVKAVEYLGRTDDSPPSPTQRRQLIPDGAKAKGYGINSNTHRYPALT
ncbi:RNB domain-containing protein [Sarocladium implicatum]|nr:RNB domain-containing protein [Sarocladium implicatum]